MVILFKHKLRTSMCWKYSAIRKHLFEEHNMTTANLRQHHCRILMKCPRKMESLIYEVHHIRRKRPKLNTQSDSIWANFLFKFYMCIYSSYQ